MSIGLAIFVLSFVLIGITAGPYLAHQVRMQTMIGFVSLVTLCMLTLTLRRPTRAPAASAKSDGPSRAAQETAGGARAATSSSIGPLILRLARITQQTPDAKTLRFIFPDDRKLNARPDQFPAFSFLFEGKKALAAGATHLLLDNLTPASARQWIAHIAGRATSVRAVNINFTVEPAV